MRPHPFRRMWGKTALQHRKGPVRFTSRTPRHFSSSRSSTSSVVAMPRVVHQDVDPAEVRHGLAHQGVDLAGVADVGSHRDGPPALTLNPFRGRGRTLSVDVGDGHGGAGFREHGGNARANPGTGSGDNGPHLGPAPRTRSGPGGRSRRRPEPGTSPEPCPTPRAWPRRGWPAVFGFCLKRPRRLGWQSASN
jgi:hypothetical protein